MVRKAVLVGVSYADNVYLPKLQGAENDVRKAKTVLSAKFGFQEEDVRVLIDGPCPAFGKSCVLPPTQKNILEAIDWLVCGATEGDVLLFHFSGHGSQLPPPSASDPACAGEGGLHDILLPSDVCVACNSISNYITSDEFKCKFARIPKGVTTVQVFDTGFGVSDACASGAGKRGYFLGTWSSTVLTAGGKTAERGKFAAISSASAAACDKPAMRELLFQWPSAWFAAAHGEAALETPRIDDGCVAGVFSLHFYDLLASLEEPCLTNELLVSFVSRALRTACFKQQPQFVAVDRSLDRLPIFPPRAIPPPPPCPSALPVAAPDCCSAVAPACSPVNLPRVCARVCPDPPSDNGCAMTRAPPCPPATAECPRPAELLVGELVRLLGITGFDIACRIESGWAEMEVGEQRKVYLELQSLGGVEAVKIGAELARDVCFFKLVSEFGSDAIYFDHTAAAAQSLAKTCITSTPCCPPPPEPATFPPPSPSSGEELGRCTWMFLHALADQYPDCPTQQQRRDVNDILSIMTRIYPCEGCADHFKQLLDDHPPRTSNGFEFQQWMCEAHNMVNRKIGKPEYPCHKLVRRAHTSACLVGGGGGGCDGKPAGAGACMGGACAVRPAAAPAAAAAKPAYVAPPAAASRAYVPPPPAKKVAAVPAAPPPFFAAPKAAAAIGSSSPAPASDTRVPWVPPVVARPPAYALDSYPFLRATNAAAAATRPSYEKKSSAVAPPPAVVTAPAPPPPRRSCPYCPAGKA